MKVRGQFFYETWVGRFITLCIVIFILVIVLKQKNSTDETDKDLESGQLTGDKNIDWSPMGSPINIFQTKLKAFKLDQPEDDRLEIVSTFWAKFIYIFCMTVGLIGFFLFFYESLVNLQLDVKVIFGTLFTLSMTAVGGIMLYYSNRPFVFDKKEGKFYCKDISFINIFTTESSSYQLNEIQALQIIEGRTANCYELNIVFKNSSRKKLLNRRNLDSIKKIARKIETFINIPIWSKLS